ncbi:MAG: hypothetical protein UV46_C0043G0001, partial [Candidatus Gottesmanbacteria bacterium GW2011_GWC2_42_8]
RSTTLRVVALQRAGNASDYDFEKMFELGTIGTPRRKFQGVLVRLASLGD